MRTVQIPRAEYQELQRDAEFARDVVAAIEAGKDDHFVILSLIGDALLKLATAATIAEAKEP